MAAFDVAPLAEPLPGDEPCGPDLDAEGDGAFLNFVANAEMILPQSFFVPRPDDPDGPTVPFDRRQIDTKRELATLREIMARTRDIRLFCLLARFQALDRDLEGFTLAIEAAAQMLEGFWDEVHPRGEGASFMLRASALGALDLPTVVFPLQYVGLVRHKRLGDVSLRMQMFTEGTKPRDGEAAPSASAILEALREAAETELPATRALLDRACRALAGIEMAFGTHAALDTPAIGKTAAILERMRALVEAAVPSADTAADGGLEDGAAPAAPGQAAAPGAGGDMRSAGDVRRALAAVGDYFRRAEPSSPVLPLVRQAQALVGKSFVDVMQALLPAEVGLAAYQIGADRFFELNVERVAAALDSESGEAEEAVEEPAPVVVATRGEAMLLLDRVTGYYRRAEPASPIPWLIERARRLADQDFLAVLRAVLPPDALKNLNAEG